MSTLKSSAENLTLNADGANNDIILQSNGSTKVTLDGQNTRLGIGTATPTQSLDVIGNIDFGANSNGFIEEDGAVVRYKNTGTGTTHLMSHDGNEDITLDASGFIQFEAAGTVEARIDADGLKFGTDTAAANALDDYEEGTWTPTLNNTGGSPSYTWQVGNYVKIGSWVWLTANVKFTVTPSGVTHQAVGGLPFTSKSGSGQYVGAEIHPYQGFNYNNDGIMAAIFDGSTIAYIYNYTASTTYNRGSVLANMIGTTVEFQFTACYPT